jgi:biotin carboxyl carrier protein
LRLELTTRRGSKTRDHRLELPTQALLPTSDRGRVQLVLDGEIIEVDWAEITPGLFSILIGGRSYQVEVSGRSQGELRAPESLRRVMVGTRPYLVEVRDPRLRRPGGSGLGPDAPQEILAPMPGKIVKVLVAENDKVGQGDGLVVIEAMKMQNELRAPRPGRVEKIYTAEGLGVETGSRLLRLA